MTLTITQFEEKDLSMDVADHDNNYAYSETVPVSLYEYARQTGEANGTQVA
jgi:hypothetical protein